MMMKSLLVCLALVCVLSSAAEKKCAAEGNCDKEIVVLTGGLGFIGSHVIEALVKKGYQVEVYDDASNGRNFKTVARYHDAQWDEGDITKTNDFSKLPKKVDYVIHLAAAISVAESMNDPGKYTRTNVEGSRLVLEYAKAAGAKMVVAASSAAIYGDIPDKLPIAESEGYGGKSPYAETKWAMEKLMEKFNKEQGLPTTALRFFNVYGPRQDPTSPYSGVISKFMDMSKKNLDVTIFGDGEQTRDFVYVKDVARGIIAAMESKRTEFDAFNICTGKVTTVKDLANVVITSFGASSKIVHGPARDGDIKKSVCRPSKAKEGIGFEYAVEVEEGLAATRDWFQGKTD